MEAVSGVSGRHQLIRETAHQFADREIRPVAVELDETERFPSEIYKKMARLGMFGITVPEELGSGGADVVSYAHVMEELSRGYASVADQCGLVELVATLIATHGSPQQ
jgi:alkylation response protein AidB-like acyl-CoA dehydrogenase